MGSPKPPKRWLAYWLIGFIVLAFGVPEFYGVVVDDAAGDTFSETTRFVVNAHPILKVSFVGLLTWFAWHILWQKPRSTRTYVGDDDE